MRYNIVESTMKRYYILHTIYFIFICLVFINPIHAQEFFLELQQIEPTDEAQRRPKISPDHLAELENQGYSILSSNTKPAEFYFHIDRTDVSFTDLSEGGSFVESIEMQVKSEGGAQYQILNKLISSFHSLAGQTIEPTSCDDGCSVRVAKPWKSEDSYGWGYSIDDGNTYRPFSRESVGLITPLSLSKSALEMKLKVRTPKNQSEGNFQGVVQLIALPEM